jgi:DNA-binding beta-propeller fold protein YncE
MSGIAGARGRRLFLAIAILLAASPAARAAPYLWQTNAYGNDIHIYNLDSFQLVSRLEVGANPHGIAVSGDRRTIYVSLERYGQPHGELLWIDAATRVIEKRIETCAEPQNIALTPAGTRLYVACMNGRYRVVDTGSGATVREIKTGGRPHNVVPSADGRYMYLAPLGDPHGVSVVDVRAGHRPAGFIAFGGQVRPLALSRDGRLLFQQVDGVNGFKVADTQRRAVLTTVVHQSGPGWLQPVELLVNKVARRLGFKPPLRPTHCHGIAVRPDQQEIWASCGHNLNIHRLDREDYAEIAHVRLAGTGYWINFSADSRLAAVALTDRNQVAVVDARDKHIIRLLATGNGPKRNIIIDQAE